VPLKAKVPNVRLPLLLMPCKDRPFVPDMVAMAAAPIEREAEPVPTSTAERVLPPFNVTELVRPSAPTTVA